jgi:RNA polymerase sigma-70 factor (ECF subfamily)
MDTRRDDLIERLRRGDAEALAEFITSRHGQLLGYIERNLGAALRRKIEPEDILQELSADAIRALSGIDLAGRDPLGWLCQIAERRIIDAHRRFYGSQKRNAGREVAIDAPRGDDQRGLIDLLVASMTSASQAFSRNQREQRLLEALASLKEEQREALRLRYVENLPSKEIAQRLGKTDGSVRVLLTRSLHRLHELLGPESSP